MTAEEELRAAVRTAAAEGLGFLEIAGVVMDEWEKRTVEDQG